MMTLAENLEINAVDYANQGNSIIGIRGSGKTYTATKAAEELMLANIPIIAFDPTGVWCNLKFGVYGFTGFPVVVAGGFNADLPLTEENVVKIVEAALKERVSLIIDLQETGNKSKWMRIVGDCVEYLIGNNQQYGLRHVFIEEAAEFVPQRPSPGGALVYSRIERMARLGRNFGLGYTLINQRAEEISKAVFEISELVLVHRQSGKNSLNSIKDWLSVRGQSDKGVVQTLPSLLNGECWAIDDKQEVRIKVLPKRTFHPDPKKGLNTAPDGTNADVSGFIKNMRASIDEVEKPTTIKSLVNDAKLVQENKDLVSRLESALDTIEELEKEKHLLKAKFEQIAAIASTVSIGFDIKVPEKPAIGQEPIIKKELVTIKTPNKTYSGAMRMLKAAAMYFPAPITKQRMATLSGLSVKSGSFSTYITTLKRNNHITGEGNNFTITKEGLHCAADLEDLPSTPNDMLELWCRIIGNNGATRILRFVQSKYPNYCTKAEVGEATSLSSASGSFGTYLTTLKRHGLITVDSGRIKAAEELFK